MSENGEVEEDTRHKFVPIERQDTPSDIIIPGQDVVTVLQSQCTFPADIFNQIMYNLIKNPNITSSHLFRADIFYDSGEHTDLSLNPTKADLQKHLKQEYRPRNIDLPEWNLTRTIVRKLIPRNPQLDPPLIQTCHFYTNSSSSSSHHLILYIPHITPSQAMPFYHPAVSTVLFLHTSTSSPTTTTPSPTISISYTPHPSSPITPKLHRTALRLLHTIHKHGQGQLTGYTKRVHHDRIIPQAQYQDTYTRLKAKYGRALAREWKCVTDPGKHVFEDIGIAAFLIEVWRGMYYCFDDFEGGDGEGVGDGGKKRKRKFPGFVDIGCGNGLLVHLLVEEGYEGWGFDARKRNSWEGLQGRLEERVLVPDVLFGHGQGNGREEKWHNGMFREEGREEGPFIISNHADELTLWTPLLAYLNRSSFIAIPCCSHDLSGARFRAPSTTKAAKQSSHDTKHVDSTDHGSTLEHSDDPVPSQGNGENGRVGAAESGSLLALRPRAPASPPPCSTHTNGTTAKDNRSKMPSAYASLCCYLSALTAEVAYKPETEVLRIPSTRNMSVVGRYTTSQDDDETRRKKIVSMVERELNRSIETVGEDWTARAHKISMKPGSGH